MVDVLVKMAKVHIRAKAQHPFRWIKQQFGFQKARPGSSLKLFNGTSEVLFGI
ncbi:MAG: hypothetical protein ACODUE_09700 [Synechococcus sp.]